MTKFLLVYGGGEPPADEASGAKVMAEWIAWFGALGPAIVNGGEPTAPLAKRISSNGSVSDATDGLVTGYSIIEAGSLDEAVRMAKSCPHLNAGGTVTVYETIPVM